MQPTQAKGRPAWLILLLIAAVFALLILGAKLLTADTEDTQTDNLVNELCEGTDC